MKEILLRLFVNPSHLKVILDIHVYVHITLFVVKFGKKQKRLGA